MLNGEHEGQGSKCVWWCRIFRSEFCCQLCAQVRKLKQALNKRKKEADAKEQQQRKENEKAKQAKEETEREEVW